MSKCVHLNSDDVICSARAMLHESFDKFCEIQDIVEGGDGANDFCMTNAMCLFSNSLNLLDAVVDALDDNDEEDGDKPEDNNDESGSKKDSKTVH